MDTGIYVLRAFRERSRRGDAVVFSAVGHATAMVSVNVNGHEMDSFRQRRALRKQGNMGTFIDSALGTRTYANSLREDE